MKTLNYQLLHNTSVGVAFIGTVLVVLEVLRELEAVEIATGQSLDVPGFILVIVGSILASWTAGKMDKENKKG